MKYAVFVCECYYPGGGIEDLWKTFDSLDEVKEALKDEVTNFNSKFLSDIQVIEISSLKLVGRIRPCKLESLSEERYGSKTVTKRIPEGMLEFQGREVGKLEGNEVIRLEETYEHEALLVPTKAVYLEEVEAIGKEQ